MFADLQAELKALPELAIVAIGGLPVVLSEGEHRLMDTPLTQQRLREQIILGIGLGAVLTHRNPNDKTLAQLGDMCLERQHLWTAHVLSLTIVFDKAPMALRNALAFDRRFHLSWVEREVRSKLCTFTATGSLREWYRVCGYRTDGSFNAIQRSWFSKLNDLLAPLLKSGS